jgi:hypothetical protein
MKQEEAKRLIIREWDRWVQTQSINSGRATGRDSFKGTSNNDDFVVGSPAAVA